MDFGATIVGIDAPDSDGALDDVVLGFDSVDGYIGNDAGFGMTIAPAPTASPGARCTIDGTEWELLANENGNNLHTTAPMRSSSACGTSRSMRTPAPCA